MEELFVVAMLVGSVVSVYAFSVLGVRRAEERKAQKWIASCTAPSTGKRGLDRLYALAAEIYVRHQIIREKKEFYGDNKRSTRIDHLRYLVEEFEGALFQHFGSEYHALCLLGASALRAPTLDESLVRRVTEEMLELARRSKWSPAACSIAGVGVLLVLEPGSNSVHGMAIRIGESALLRDRTVTEPFLSAVGAGRPMRAA